MIAHRYSPEASAAMNEALGAAILARIVAEAHAQAVKAVAS